MKRKFISVLLALVLVLSFSLVMAVPAAAADIPVASGESIQAAINAALPGDTVLVAAGTYEEAIVIDKSLTLQGEDRDTTEIKFGYVSYPSLQPLVISADEVTVSGFTIRSGPYVEKDPFTTAVGGYAHTIIVDGDSALLTDLHVIKDPLLTYNDQPRMGGSAFLLTPGLDGFTLTDSIVESEWNGIYTREEGSDITVRNVEFTYLGTFAIMLKQITGATIEGNIFTNTGNELGLLVSRGCEGIEITDNKFVGSGSLESSHIGILLQDFKLGPVGVSILRNDISGFDRGIKVEANIETSGIHINYNSITGDTYSVENLALTTVDATYNWWGDASGPSGVGPGTGDAVSANVDYDPWLKAPYRPTTLMSSFTIDHAKVDFKKKADDDKVRVQGKLELDLDNGDGVNISEDVIVTVGPLFETITMVEKGKKDDRWHYQRPKEDGTGDIKHMTINWKNGKFDIRMDKADLSELTDPEVTISIQIGDDVGEKTILMREKEHHWDYKAK